MDCWASQSTVLERVNRGQKIRRQDGRDEEQRVTRDASLLPERGPEKKIARKERSTGRSSADN